MRTRHGVLAWLALGAVITYVDRVCIAVAAGSIRRDLGLSLRQWGWVLGIFVIAYGIFEMPAGAWGDRVGPRRALARIVGWWSVWTALTGLARGFGSLLGIRFLFGAGEAGAFPNFSVAIQRWYPKGQRARAQSVIWMATRLGGAVAPLLVIPLQRWLGWRESFAVLGVGGLGWTVVWWVGWREAPAAATPAERAEQRDGAWTGVFRERNLWWIMLMYHANAWLGFFYLTWLYTFLAKGRGFTSDDLLRLSWLPFVVGAAANLVGGTVSDGLVRRVGLKWGRSLPGAAGLAAAAACIVGAELARGKLATVGFLAVGYGCSDFAMPIAWAVCLDVGGSRVGMVAGAMNTAGQLGSFLTTVLFGYLVEGFHSYNAPLVPIAIMSMVGAMAWLRIDASRVGGQEECRGRFLST